MKKTGLILTAALFCLSLGHGILTGNTDKTGSDESTIITPVLESRIPSEKNLLYSCTFQLAWNEFTEKGKFNTDSDLVKSLNRKHITKDILSDESYLTAVITDKDGLIRLNKNLKDKFGINTPAEIGDDLLKGNIIFTYMSKSLQFNKDFNEIAGGIYFGDEGGQRRGRVKTFGIQGFRKEKHAGLEKQVVIYDYKAPDDFIILLNPKSVKDEIILARIIPEKTLLDTIITAEKRIRNSKPELLKHADNLYIPEISLNTEHSFKELESGSLIRAYQKTEFSLNKSGAEVRSESRIVYRDGGYERSFIFNKPFLICLKEKGKKYPYFALWVNNTGFMTFNN